MERQNVLLYEMAQYQKEDIIFKFIYKYDSFQSNLKHIFITK